MKSASNSGQDQYPQQKGVDQRHLRMMRWVLGVVILMAVVAASALWLALNHARGLARPSQHNDLWYISSVNNELSRVALLTHQTVTGEASRDDLLLRLDVLYSVLDHSPTAPKVNVQFRENLPETAQVLEALARAVDNWARRLEQSSGTDANTDLRRVLDEVQGFREPIAKAVADVHVANTLEADRQRQRLLQSFTLLSLALLFVLAGTALLIWRALKDRQIAVQTSQALNEANQMLETRVRERTRQIDEAHNLLTFILDASPSDVALIDAEGGRVHYINRRLMERLGMRQQPQTLRLHELLHDPQAGQALLQALDQSGQIHGVEALIASQPPYWSSLSAQLIEVEGRLCHLVWGFDISIHKHLENELRLLATTDVLTGLNNRRAFLEKADAILEHCRRYRNACGALMIDIDHFKAVNDRHGHHVGDDALRATGRAILQVLREADVVGRLGGEEFAVLLPNADPQGTRDTTERIRQAVEAIALPLANGETLRFTVSLGLASFQPPGQTLAQLLAQADQALYRAKAEGRNRAVAYTAEMLDL
ncbi:sensor domain-containing diguanylate cyclase [Hydrogenophaga sp. OTU3427]|uniref:sensor domain-containing diguanylate cyclase n=1 Tax=Hydrogenophaga sp. OTU3427 TaxID=3043856 RepID=UPI00313D0BCD